MPSLLEKQNATKTTNIYKQYVGNINPTHSQTKELKAKSRKTKPKSIADMTI